MTTVGQSNLYQKFCNHYRKKLNGKCNTVLSSTLIVNVYSVMKCTANIYTESTVEKLYFVLDYSFLTVFGLQFNQCKN